VHLADGTELRFASTDGHRLARVAMAMPEGAEGLTGCIVPRKTVNVLLALLAQSEDAVEMEFGARCCRLHIGGDVTITSKLIDGTFPDYSRVIPTANDKLLSIDARELARAIERVTILSTDKTRAVKCALTKDKLTLTVHSPEHGSATEDVPCDYTAAPLEIGFNGVYLAGLLPHVASDAPCRIALADTAAPTLFRSGDSDGALFVLMPMRV